MVIRNTSMTYYVSKSAMMRMESLVNELADSIEAPRDITDKALDIAIRCIEKGLTRGRSYKCVALASLYAASRILGRPFPLKRISTIAGVPLKDLRSCYNSILETFERELREIRPPDPRSYIGYIAKRLGLGDEVVSEALKILDEIRRKTPIEGKDPTGYATAAIYIASERLGQRLSKNKLSIETGLTEVTIRTRIKEVAERLGIKVENI
ncbi:MAG TPA: hypothetical protein VNL13_08735 [Sulfolobales archaeon]|nr:hypothetical protein [Sulfolobales archaeon]